MIWKIALIALLIYFVVIMRLKIRLPHPGLQATVDVLTAADLKDAEVVQMARQYVRYSDTQNTIPPSDDPHSRRLESLTERYISVNDIPLNFKVYKTSAMSAFATADGSIRVFSGLMDRLTDDELMAIVGHEMGHIRNHDTIGAIRKAYLTSAARNALGAVGGVIGSMSASQLGSVAEKLTSSKFSQGQEFAADDFSFGFLLRNNYDPYAMATALEKIETIAASPGSEAQEIARLFSTHPDTRLRANRMRARADAHLKRISNP